MKFLFLMYPHKLKCSSQIKLMRREFQKTNLV